MTDKTPDAHPPSVRQETVWPPGGLVDSGQSAPAPSYMVGGRDLRIDLLRGYFVVAMIVDHVRGQSFLYLLTGGNRFFTSAAEGFILTSGLVAGVVYGRVIKRLGIGPAISKILGRAATLYLLTVSVTLLFLPLSEILYLPWAQGIDLTDGLAVLMSIVTLHRTYYLIDVMLLYTVLFVLVPIGFALMSAGKSRLVLGASWALWAVFQFYPDYAALPWPIAGNYLFDFSAWQVLFVSGLALGCHRGRLPVLSPRTARLVLAGLTAAVVALIGLFFIVEPPYAVVPPDIAIGRLILHDARTWLQEMVFSKYALRPGRLVASAIVFSFLFVLVSLFWRQTSRLVGWLLVPLGQRALYAYTAHIAIVSIVALALAPFKLPNPGPQWLNALVQLGSVLLIWYLARVRFLSPTPANQRVWNAAPAAAFAVMLVLLAWYPTPSHPGLEDPPVASAASSQGASRRFGTPIPAEEEAAIRAQQLPVVPLPAVSATPPAATVLTPTPSPAPNGPTAAATVPARTPTAAPTPQPRPPAAVDLQGRLDGYQVGDLAGTLEEHWFYSESLNWDMPYLIYLPPDYRTAGRRYPVMYMLHGLGGTRDEWLEMGFVDDADRAMRTAQVPPMLLVMPQGDLSYWVNHAGDGARWGEYLVRDVVSHVDATYRTLRSPAARGVAGISMGAWGALSDAFAHPEVFGVVAGHSASIRVFDPSLSFLGTADEFAMVDPLRVAAAAPSGIALQVWLDIGADDPWRASATVLHDLLLQKGIEHTWQVYPGGHLWAYWHEHFVDYLRFYGEALSPR